VISGFASFLFLLWRGALISCSFLKQNVVRVKSLVVNGCSNNGISKKWPAVSSTAVSVDEAKLVV
jgi:hypothetical protein